MRAAVEHHFNGPTGSLASYDSTKTLIASLLRQASGSNTEDNFISTKPAVMANLPEFVVAAQHMPHVYKWSDNIYWIFAMSSAAATATRTITLTEFNATTSTLNYKGYITLSGTTIAGTKIGRSLRAFVYKHTTGTVSTTGASSTINGSGTGFQSERIAAGARIGFGTTDPTQVTTWYNISSISNDTTLVIDSAVTLSAGTSYVIEEIRIAIPTTASTIAIIQGGIHLIKGVNYNTFTNGGTTILESSLTTPANTDNIRASYLLTDGLFSGSLATQTVTIPISASAQLTASNHGLINSDPIVITTTGATPTGITATTTTATVYYVINTSTNNFQLSTALNGSALTTTGAQSGTHTIHYYPRMAAATIATDDFVSNTEHDLYLVGTLGTAVSVIKYNIRAALTVGALGTVPNITGGTSPSAFVFRTGTVAVTGTPSQVNSGRIFTVAHGPGSGSKSLYFATTSRIYRCPLNQIFSGSTSYLYEAMQEVPPGGVTAGVGNIYTVLGSMAQVDYSATIDRLFIPTTTGRFGTYVGQFATNTSTAFEKIIGSNLNRLRYSSDATGATDGVFPQAILNIWTEDGWMFATPSTTTSGQNWLYVWPFGADAYYNSTSNQHIITPKLATPNASKLYHVYVDHQEYAGTYGLGFPVETYRLWYRTSGIDDNSGAWTEVPVGADLTAAAPGDYIQFKIAFDIMGEICVPTRIYSICCTYEDKSQDSHYEPSLTKSSAQNRIFAWRQISSWGGTIPNLRIRLFNVANGATVLDDDVTSNTYGTWQYSTDGTNWLSWSSSADTIGNYIRYTADDGIIGNLITVRALLTQA